MAPRKRTPTEKPETTADLVPLMEAKPKVTKPVVKKTAKAEISAPVTPVEKAELIKKKTKGSAKAPVLEPVIEPVVPVVPVPKLETARKSRVTPKAAPKKQDVVEVPSKPQEMVSTKPLARTAKPIAAAVKSVVGEPKTSSAPKPLAAAPRPLTAAPKPLAAAPRPAAKEVASSRPMPSFTPHAQKVMEAIAEGRAIELIFADGDAYPPRTFEARQLIFDIFTSSWFVWGWDRRYNAERHHRLDLLVEINLVDGPGRSAQGPFLENTPANQIGGWRGGEPILLKAVLQKQWIFAIKQAPAPFPDFLIEDLEDGKAQVTFVGTDLRAIARWCMQFGDGIQVQEPQRLVDRIRQVGVSWAGKAPASPMPPPAPRTHPRPEPRQEPRREARPESRPEPRSEFRPEPRRQEAPRKDVRESRDSVESEASKGKPVRVEVRIERL